MCRNFVFLVNSVLERTQHFPNHGHCESVCPGFFKFSPQHMFSPLNNEHAVCQKSGNFEGVGQSFFFKKVMARRRSPKRAFVGLRMAFVSLCQVMYKWEERSLSDMIGPTSIIIVTSLVVRFLLLFCFFLWSHREYVLMRAVPVSSTRIGTFRAPGFEYPS